jgi:hypothetical protein
MRFTENEKKFVTTTDGLAITAGHRLGSPPACAQADFFIRSASNNPGVIAAGTGVASWSGLTLNKTNGSANQDNSKGITVPITYSAN